MLGTRQTQYFTKNRITKIYNLNVMPYFLEEAYSSLNTKYKLMLRVRQVSDTKLGALHATEPTEISEAAKDKLETGKTPGKSGMGGRRKHRSENEYEKR